MICEKTPLSETEYIFSTWGMPPLSSEDIQRHFPHLRAIFYAAGSVKRFAEPFLNCGIKISSAYAANAIPVAEFTVSQILLASKGIFRSSALYSKGEIDATRRIAASYPGNYGIRIGLVGAGMVGRAVCRLLGSYSVEVLVYDPHLSHEDALSLGAKKATLEEIFSTCMVVSNHVPNIPSTRRMFDYRLFSQMRENATFINTGRGAQVVEDDLCRILSERSDLVALLDVTDPEPPHSSSPLFTLPNAILTPHIAGSLGSETLRMGEYMLEEYRRFAAGKPLQYEITADMLPDLA
ncbi:MAG: hydroxyacid dehydrogenase [Clostridia bacterium]|nr:hydroxyacid dehydrogenase [Clostridia bacterium]